MSKEDHPDITPLEERIDFRNRWIAGGLAWFIPGAGHLYQRRYFKGIVYFVCIMGIFVWGSSMGEAKAVHLRWDKSGDAKTRTRTLGYLAQVGIGVPAWPAAFQKMRAEKQDEAFEQQRPAGQVIEEFNTEFTGLLRDAQGGDATVTGTLTGVLQAGDFAGEEFVGTFQGKTLEEGTPVELEVGGNRRFEMSEDLHIGRKICALDDVTLSSGPQQDGRIFSPNRRRFFARLINSDGFIEGTIPRSFVNHYQVPLDDAALQHIHGRLGKQYELALVYTWIAGLLNVLAIWDCVQGPAYGYGDEPEPEPEVDEGKGKAEATAKPESTKAEA